MSYETYEALIELIRGPTGCRSATEEEIERYLTGP